MGNMTMNSTFGVYLRQLREGKGWTVRQAAVKACISNPYLSQLERDYRKDHPSMKTLRQLARAYEVPEAQMFNAAGCRIEDIDAEYKEALSRLQAEITTLREDFRQVMLQRQEETRAMLEMQKETVTLLRRMAGRWEAKTAGTSLERRRRKRFYSEDLRG